MRPFLFALMCLDVSCTAAQLYISPSGSGDGTFANPWGLQFALTNAAQITNGDTLWLRAGTYQGLFTTTIKSTASNAPVIVRNYSRERAVIDGQLTIGFNSTNVWFWGLEVIDSNKTNRINPFDTITGGGRGTKLINCLVHDCCIGVAGGGTSGMQEAYGNVLWNCGKSTVEHGFYWQNEWDEPRTIENNLIGYSSGFGIHCYGSSGQLKNLNIISNAVWVSSDKSDILLGGSQPVQAGVVNGNQTWNGGGRGVEIGNAGGVQNSNAFVFGNYIYAAYSIKLDAPFDNLTITNNTVSDAYAACAQTQPDSLTTTTANWDYNTYFGLGGSPWVTYFWFSNSTDFISWDLWRSVNGFDAHSTYVSNVYAPDVVTVLPNKYEPKRANLLVWNWTGAQTASADVSSVLSVGDSYELRYAQNWFAGPAATGTYQGGSITVPLTNLPAMADRLYDVTWTGQINTNLFAFVLLGVPRIASVTTFRAGTVHVQ